ncbi:MAG: hypothetical protein JRG92_19695 [Deltaproteobacteria bacterium]|nr:hypothetical protein [Deltaproteobacteria bacterium]MBW2385862.1 hypothetical protein [Deltaproteobacteria bacterium]MBW2697745.1 hypothetical protein [Deltaproteobacteria bacterium]
MSELRAGVEVHATLLEFGAKAISWLLVLFSSTSTFAGEASFIGLGDLPGGEFHSEIGGLSADGTLAAGSSIVDEHGRMHAFLWTREGGLLDLGDLAGVCSGA